MEGLATLTQTDINNGALFRMLTKAGIPNAQEYVERFHHETEELIREDFEHPMSNRADDDEQLVPPADIQRWITGFRPNLDSSIPPTVVQEEKHEQPSPKDVQSWITGLRLRLDDPAQPPPAPSQQQPQRNIPTDLKSWMHHMTPIGLHSPANAATPVVIADETTVTRDDDEPSVTGNLSTWLTDWSKNLTEQPPPTSLDNWLQRLVPTNMHEPLTKGNTPKGRLNSYLNAAQEVLSEHGYDVSTQAKAPVSAPTNSGMFGNVKQMYFLWKVLDKNNDRKITVEDVQIMLQEMGLGFLSKYVAQTLFDMVDTDHDDALQFRDFVAMMGIIKQLVGAMGSVKA